MFLKGYFLKVVKSRECVLKGLILNHTIPTLNHLPRNTDFKSLYYTIPTLNYLPHNTDLKPL